ncbi:uncharacterized protein F4822DRAFT_123176 [Hypoxylon trugodes]|uniref:uncharacterized protein n=1 Tax=Hypoxylon trugodes TaxID=326681 RepID=UPI002199AEAE|nr:uncharacterized protein F4822DRAFT_123176 [Hypoxylon trugodes]KAI1392281.1 hypothetical protein F4822DRAFT_123176 [Hypoxylon trugodes]
MDSRSTLTSDNPFSTSKFMGSSFSEIAPIRESLGHQKKRHCTQPSDTCGQPLSNSTKECQLFQGAVDDCSRSRLYARMLQHYFIDEVYDPSARVRCPMPNCNRDFENGKKMLLHFKNCSSFDEGLIKCPICNRIERFRRTSKKKCCWFRPTLTQRLQNKVRNTVDTIKNLSCTRRESSPRWPETPDYYSPSSSLVNPTPFSINAKTPSTPDYWGLSTPVTAQEVQGTPLYELQDTKKPLELCELQGTNGLSELYELQGTDGPLGLCELQGTNGPLELYELQGTDMPLELSHEMAIGTSKTVSSASSMSRVLASPLANHDQHAEGPMESAQDASHLDGTAFDWQQPLSQPHNASPTCCGVNQGYCNQQGLRDRKKLLMTISGNNTKSDSDSLEWNIPLPAGGTSCLPELPATGIMRTLPATNPEMYMGSGLDHFDIGSQNIINHNISTPPASALPMTPARPPGPEPIEQDFRCHYAGCDYVPKGKRENRGSYLKKHTSTHTRDRVSKCPYCDNTYTRPDNRDVHVRKAHANKRRQESWDDAAPDEREGKRISYRGGVC